MSDAKGINVLAICGSLRTGSYNRAALRTAIELGPPGMTIETADIAAFPLYNEDVRAQGFPPPVETLRRQIAAADALLFVTPEYNRSVPGGLKNALDVGSRPYGKSWFLGKPVGIISNSPGALGGVSAAKHLQNILPGIARPILGQPEIYLNGIGDAFDDKGQLTKEAVQKVLQQYIDAFAAFIEKQNG